MPMPKPKAEESREDYVSRFMGDASMRREYPDEKQRAAVAHAEWRRRRKLAKDDIVRGLDQCKTKTDKLIAKLRQWHESSETDESPSGFEMTCSICKVEDAEDHTFVYGPVMVPEVEDKQGDVISSDEIEKTAHSYIEDSGGAGLLHRMMLGSRDVAVVESHVLRQPFTLSKDEELPVGTWMIGMNIYASKIRKLVLSGKLKGFSIGGQGLRVEE